MFHLVFKLTKMIFIGIGSKTSGLRKKIRLSVGKLKLSEKSLDVQQILPTNPEQRKFCMT